MRRLLPLPARNVLQPELKQVRHSRNLHHVVAEHEIKNARNLSNSPEGSFRMPRGTNSRRSRDSQESSTDSSDSTRFRKNPNYTRRGNGNHYRDGYVNITTCLRLGRHLSSIHSVLKERILH